MLLNTVPQATPNQDGETPTHTLKKDKVTEVCQGKLLFPLLNSPHYSHSKWSFWGGFFQGISHHHMPLITRCHPTGIIHPKNKPHQTGHPKNEQVWMSKRDVEEEQDVSADCNYSYRVKKHRWALKYLHVSIRIRKFKLSMEIDYHLRFRTSNQTRQLIIPIFSHSRRVTNQSWRALIGWSISLWI